MSELKPCPFCGSTPSVHPVELGKPNQYTASCDNTKCPAGPFVVETGEGQAVAAWNTRPADAVRDGVVIQNAVVQFLLGAAPIDGKWFGDLHPKHPGRLWWRRLLRAALAQDGRG